MSAALDQPVLVVEVCLNSMQGEAELLDGGEGPDPEEVLLQGPDEALRAAVALGRADEGGGRRGPEAQATSRWKSWDMYCDPWSWRTAEALGGVLRTTPTEALHDALGGSARAPQSAWPLRAAWMPVHSRRSNGRRRRSTATWPCSSGEGRQSYPCPTSSSDRLADDGSCRRRVRRAAGAAHPSWPPTGRSRGIRRRTRSLERAQAPVDARARDAPDLAVALAVEGTVRQRRRADRLDQAGVVHRTHRPRPPTRRGRHDRQLRRLTIDARARDAPHPRL